VNDFMLSRFRSDDENLVWTRIYDNNIIMTYYYNVDEKKSRMTVDLFTIVFGKITHTTHIV